MEWVPIIGGSTTEMISINPRNIIGYSGNSDGYTELLYYSELNGGKPISLVLGITKEEFDAIVLASNTITILYADVLNATTGALTATSYNENYIVSLRDLTTTIAGMPGVSVVELTYSMGSLGNKKILISGTVGALVRAIPSYMVPQVNSDWNAVSGVAKILNKPKSIPASDVYAWAKQSVKPSYSFSEIESKPTTISGYGITDIPTTLPASDVYAWAKVPTKPTYGWSEIGSKPTTLSTIATNDLGNYGSFLIAADISGIVADPSIVHINNEEIITSKKTITQSISQTSIPTYGFTNNLVQTSGSGTHRTEAIRNIITFSGTASDEGLRGINTGTFHSSTGTIENLYGIGNFVFIDGGGVSTNIWGIANTITNNGKFNKLMGVSGQVTNTSTNVLNNDAYLFSGTFNNSGVLDGFSGFQVDATNTGTLTVMSGLQIDLYNAGGTCTNLYGINLGAAHNWTGTPVNSYGIYIDASTNIGSVENYAIYSGSTAPSYFAGSLTANSLIKIGGTSAQFLKADGGVDSTVYEPAFSKNTGFNKDFGTVAGTVLEGRTFGTAAASATTDFAPASGSDYYIQNQSSSAQGSNIWSSGVAWFGGNNINSFRFHNNYSGGSAGVDLYNASGVLSFYHNGYDGSTYSLGKITTPSFLESTVATGTSPLSITSTTLVGNLNADLLDGNHASAFQTALTNPITGTGTSGYIPKFTGANTQGNSNIYDNGTNIGFGTTSPLNNLQINDASVSTIRLKGNETNNGTFTKKGEIIFSSDVSSFSDRGASISMWQDWVSKGELRFDVSANATRSTAMIIKANSYVGIGNTDPLSPFHVVTQSDTYAGGGNFASASPLPQASILAGAAGVSGAILAASVNQTTNTGFISAIKPGVEWGNLVFQAFGGNVGIGTIEPLANLDILQTGTQHIEFGQDPAAIYGGGEYGLGMWTTTTYAALQYIHGGVGGVTISLNPSDGNIDVGYGGTRSEKFAVNGSGYFNGAVTALSISCSPTISSGIVSPTTTPGKIGDLFIDTAGLKIYCATGISSSADWTILN